MIISKITKYIEDNLYSKIFKPNNINFELPWYYSFKPYLAQTFVSMIVLFVEKIIEATTPFIISKIFVGQFNFIILFWIIFTGLLMSILGFNLASRTETQVFRDIDFTVNDINLNIDPIYHVTKSSALMIGKLKRAAGVFGSMMFTLAIDIPTKLIFLFVSLIALYFVNFNLAIVAFTFCLIAVLINTIFMVKVIKKYKAAHLLADDLYVSTLLENISQAQLIRATFATTERAEILKNQYQENLYATLDNYHAFSISYQISKIILTFSIIVITFMIYLSRNDAGFDLSFALATITSYSYSVLQIIGLGGIFIKTFQNTQALEDLWKYMREIGKQTFPVLK
jgi:ABC-type bacteriocin/lantibiotic exporter with double-glycine peptidase domain